jgi:hypothetical protein
MHGGQQMRDDEKLLSKVCRKLFFFKKDNF